MLNSLQDKILNYVEEHIAHFHERRLHSLGMLKLEKIIKRKNPYLFKVKHLLTAESIVRGFIDAHLSSNEETLFGDWLEGLAIFVNTVVYNGRKSGIKGIDLEFDKNATRYIVSIKSGPNWGNSSQIAKMKSDFIQAQKTLRTSHAQLNVISINGCCYGQESNPDKGLYYKYCGQQFWEFISGEKDLYLAIIKPLGHRAKEKNEQFCQNYAQIINKCTLEFGTRFCDTQGNIDWNCLVQYNSTSGFFS